MSIGLLDINYLAVLFKTTDYLSYKNNCSLPGFKGGQFEPESGGQFKMADAGLFVLADGGLFAWIFQPVKAVKKIKNKTNTCNL
jgi:hypothetical protein